MIIDVSVHNGTIDWPEVKAAGIEGAILRCGYGSDKASQDDKQFTRNAVECGRLGIPFGVYLYSYAENQKMAESEARHALRLAEGLKLAMPIFYDVEESRLGSVARQNWLTFAAAVKAAGQRVGLYTGEYYYNTHIRGVDPIAEVLWIAKYGVNNGQPGTQPRLKDGAEVDLWQYTSAGRCAGIASKGLDCSLVLTNDIFATGEAVIKKSNEEIAAEVLTGAWGNGDDRKVRLQAAGYDYSAVQKIVNSLVAKKTNQEIAKEVIAGKWGNGRTRVNKLKAAGYNPDEIQALVNKMV